MQAIWKFAIRDESHFTVRMPRGAKLLCVDTQMKLPCMWVLVDLEAPPVDRSSTLPEPDTSSARREPTSGRTSSTAGSSCTTSSTWGKDDA